MSPAAPVWRKSTHSSNGTSCVEVAMVPGAVLARDSKDARSPELTFSSAGWSAFVEEVRR